jgi:VanZ family protein
VSNSTRSRLTLLVRYWSPVVIMLLLIALESTDLLSSQHTGSWFSLFMRPFHLSPSQLADLNHLMRKTGHCVGFGILGFLTFRALRGNYRFHAQGYEGWFSSRISREAGADIFSLLWRPQWAAAAMIVVICAATADEVHQMSLPSRTGTWWDVLLDSTAALAVQILIYFVDRAKAARYKRASAAR